MAVLRVIGDVHAQIDFVIRKGKRSYLDLITDVPFSVQVGDMGDDEAYSLLASQVDSAAHRFFPGNHDFYDCLPEHCLGDFGEMLLGGVQFFFIRGAASVDKSKLLETGRRVERKLWFPEEELDDKQMDGARQQFVQSRPLM